MKFQFRETPEKIIAFFKESRIHDQALIQEIGAGLLELCEQAASGGKRLIVDFQGVELISSSMIGRLVLLNKTAKKASLDLRLANVGPNVLEVFKITRLNQAFRFDDDDPDVMAAVPSPDETEPPQS